MSQAEQQLARHDARLQDIAGTLLTAASTSVAVIRLEGAVAALQGETKQLRAQVRELRDLLDDRDQRASDERRAVRVAMISLTGVIAAALIAALATIAVALST